MNKLKGTGVALVTPFDSEGNIDYEGLKKLLDHTAQGVDYYVVQGTTGESVTTTAEEKQAILDFVINNNPNGLPIVYGVGGNNTHAVVDMFKNIDLTNVDAILSVSPYYNKPSQSGIIAHYTHVADASPVPVILYNVPGRTSSNLTAATTVALSKHKNIIGIKEASGSVEQAMEIRANAEADFLIISGDDMLTAPLMAMGATGVISVLANAFPVRFGKLVNAGLLGDYNEANLQTAALAPINEDMYVESNPVGIKEVLRQMGICGNNCRLPLLPATEKLADSIAKKLNTI